MRGLNFGPDRAVPTVIPPEVGDVYPSLVSAVDADGNEVGGIRLPAIAVPLATYTGWNVRHADIGGPGQVLSPGGTVGRSNSFPDQPGGADGVRRPARFD